MEYSTQLLIRAPAPFDWESDARFWQVDSAALKRLIRLVERTPPTEDALGDRAGASEGGT